jgi:hypothetical protein
MKTKLIIYISFSFFFIQVGCTDNNRTRKDKDFQTLISGEYAKLWIFETKDSLDCHCYYELIYKSGKMNHFLRDNRTGKFINYFNDLSDDNLNNDKNWKFRNDTLTLIGHDYLLLNISETKDTITLKPINSFLSNRKYYLIDAKLIDSFPF